MQAATTAADAIREAQAVEEAARAAELARIDEDTKLGILEARLGAQAEADDAARAARQRTQADQTSAEIKDLIAAAETALRTGAPNAAAAGRKAAVKLLDSGGTWTREAAEFALAGTDSDVANWIDTDRHLAQKQDDRENVATVSRVTTSAVATAAHQALVSGDPDAARKFLDAGVVEAAAVDNRVTIFRILGENPGPAVKEKAEAALRDGSGRALAHFLTVELAEAVKRDDHVEVFRLLGSDGPYMQSAAKIVLEGSARMRRYFVMHDQYNIARLDHDRATHIAAIRASIAHGARIAAKALQDAARASEAAAQARQAAQEASEWALKAQGYAKDADNAAKEAKDSADAADRSAASAAQSAQQAKSAASLAQVAARTANYSMRQAVASAQQAVAFAASAQSSKTQAAESSAQAGKDEKAAAAAASAAHQIEINKRDAELATSSQSAAQQAKWHEQAGTSPATEVDDDGETKFWGMWPEDVKDTKDWAKVTGHWSTVAGGAAVILGVGGFIFPPLFAVAAVVGIVSWGLQGASALLNGISYGRHDARFHQALGAFALGGILMGKGKILGRLGNQISKEAGKKIAGAAGAVGDATTTVVGWLTW
ncbi:ALF repeat-containing protein [Streptomyces sp. NPDC006512]|uniref:ALF repeat-containing protein n=1 Tax=Streptomyces sp. NPDC006512 TaxID=3154307 RepID=UPI0033A562F6